MASSIPPSASWHPALRPNSSADIPSLTPEPPCEPLELSEPAVEQTIESRHVSTSNEIPHDQPATLEPATANANNGAFLDQFTDDDPDAGVWDLSEPVAEDFSSSSHPEVASATAAAVEVEETAVPASASVAEPAPEPASEPEPVPEPLPEPASESVPLQEPVTESTPTPETAPEPPVVPANAPKHASNSSFARTAHEVNWNDDDDAEWTLPRSDTDLFNKLMPANKRTNSFPIVPPIEPQEESGALLEDTMNASVDVEDAIEQAQQQADSTAEPDFLKTFDDEDGQNGHSSFPLGGEVMGNEEAASGARFEEGLPLIPQSHLQADDDADTSKPLGFEDSFVDDAGGDDFFSQIQGGASEDADDFDLTPELQRKDTGMFIGAASNHATPPSFQHDTDTIAETEDDNAGTGSFPADTAEAASTDAPTVPQESKAAEPTELDAKWAAAFAGDDDDDFLLEDTENKVLDPAAFFGSDDEGFLEDDDAPAPAPVQAAVPAQAPSATTNGRYTPANLPSQNQPVLNTFNSVPAVPQVPAAYPPQYAPSNTAPPRTASYGAPPKPDVPKPQSFVDKAKGGYSSPYDLPMDVVSAPRKRASMQQLPRANMNSSAPPVAPPRATSMYAQPPPTGSSTSALPSPRSAQAGPKPTSQTATKPNFFEDLPVLPKPRAPRKSSSPSPQQSPYGQPPQGPPMGPPRDTVQDTLMPSPPMQPPSAQPAGQEQASLGGLVAPERISPYAQLQSTQSKPAAPANSRYSPAPPHAPASNGMVPPMAAASRYSPAPPSRSNSGNYSAVPPPGLAHQPRTSSPLAHFEVSHDPKLQKLPSPGAPQGPHHGPPMGRSGSSHAEPRLTRMSSLPPTREVEEEGMAALTQSPPSVPNRYSPQHTRRTPPPGSSMASMLSPPKRPASNYAPIPAAQAASTANFAPPPRSQTQSPGSLYGRVPTMPVNAAPRPSSAQGPTSPRETVHMGPAHVEPPRPEPARARGMSQALNLVAPTDGRELDPLQRWRGAPSTSWGVGGTLVTSFPKDIPRYGMNQALPMILRSPGEVKMKHIKDVLPLDERLGKFPGPLKAKSKKKETVAWLSQGIEVLESLSSTTFPQYVSLEDKRTEERVLLYKILRLFIENDGVLEGNPEVEKAVRQILSPQVGVDTDDLTSPIMATGGLPGSASAVTSMQSDAVDSSAIEQMRNHLLVGDREKAVWAAVDRRLWGHAMLIANTVPGDLYKQVTQEFVKKEVNHAGHGNESLATLYGVLSGNLEESVDALVPSHARAGLQLMSTSAASNQQTDDALSGLDKWRETLGLILSNRSNSDVVAITSLGNLLSGYGRAEAAHVCFIFARKHAVFGGLDDPNAHFVLVGADHKRQADQFAKDAEALLLSEVYEYGLSLASGATVSQTCSHLAGYKLQHAITLAENGSKDKALQYCEAIMTAINAQTKRSPYYHPALMAATDDIMARLKLSPKEGTSSWITKPTMNQVSSTMWDRFNKFVSGDDAQNPAQGSPGDPVGESGPFARIAGGTPTISRSPSINNFEAYGGNAGASPSVPATKASSRYAPISGQPAASYEPSSTYAPRTSMERSSGEYQHSSYEMSRGSIDANSMPSFGYQPTSSSRPQSSSYVPSAAAVPATPPQPFQPSTANSYSPYQPASIQETPLPVEPKPEIAVSDLPAEQGYQPPSYGYEPPTMNTFHPPVMQPEEPPASDIPATSTEKDSAGGSGWEPPTYQPYSYEPLTSSYEPDPEGGESDSEKPKPKKSFMDDDDDDFPSTKATPQEKSKSEKDRENEEMFRKVAEEEGELNPGRYTHVAGLANHILAKRDEAAKAQKKGWFGGWFGGAEKKEKGGGAVGSEIPNKPVRANLGEASSFVYDPDQKRWVNKKSGADNTPAKTATPPPPRSASARLSTPPPGPSSSAPPPMGTRTPPPMGMPRSVSNLSKMASMDSLVPPGGSASPPPAMSRHASAMSNMSNVSSDSNGNGSAGPPPPRPTASLSNASSIDDLIGAAGPRRPGGKKPRKSGRYVDVMAK
jgi:COPII coat assembly protein SEC16